MLAWINTMSLTLKIVPLVGLMITTDGPRLSLPTKNRVSVELMLLKVSLAKNRTVYVPVRFGATKLVL